MSMFNPAGGEADRNEGMVRALRNERRKWVAKAIVIIASRFKKGWVGLAEEFQPHILAKIGKPHVPQVWSSLTGLLIRNYEMFEHTGEHGQCAKRTSHRCDGKYLRRR